MRQTTRELEMEATIAKLQEQLYQCQDDLFRLQPITQITDTQIINQYEELCQAFRVGLTMYSFALNKNTIVVHISSWTLQ